MNAIEVEKALSMIAVSKNGSLLNKGKAIDAILRLHYKSPIVLKTVVGTDPNRVDPAYIPFPEDWQRQYNMLLPDNTTCKACIHNHRCIALFDGNPTNTSCQFTPNRFQQKTL